ncbi:MAG: hypothetical protein Q4C70_07265 [Planctomycetia bacterium]|nr:hypothetical protein [Planctomycetia bacterium]
MQKSLDVKIARILADRSCSDFILADAKDADMAYGLAAPGQSPESYGQEARFRTLDEYRNQIREVIAQGLVDIVLMSASTSDILTLRERLFEHSAITPAIRANDATDIWLAGAEGVYTGLPSRPFRSASLDYAMCGKGTCQPEERSRGASLGLYSVTFNNDLERDMETLLAFKQFRSEAAQKGFRYFLEVFAPNAPQAAIADIPRFVNDHIVRTLAGVSGAERPVFLKIPYFGPKAMEDLAGFDSSLVVGILGGSAGTTFDAFQMLWEAKKYGARVALYGRKINSSEHQLTFIQVLRRVADGDLMPVEAVQLYHAELKKLGITPRRTLEDDLRPTAQVLSYDSSSSVQVKTPTKSEEKPKNNAPKTENRTCFGNLPRGNTVPDEARQNANLTAQEKVQRNLEKLRKTFG